MSVLSRASRTRLKSSGSSTDTLPLESKSTLLLTYRPTGVV